MKNIGLLPEHIRDNVRDYRWKCGCGQSNLCVSVTKKGTIQGHCFTCGQTIFWNDNQIFGFSDVFGYTKEKVKPKRMKGGGFSYWYPRHRVRVFKPKI